MTPQQVKTLLRSYNRLEVTASIQRQRAASLRAEAKAVGVPTISRIDAGGSGHSNTSPVERACLHREKLLADADSAEHAAHEIERQKGDHCKGVTKRYIPTNTRHTKSSDRKRP